MISTHRENEKYKKFGYRLLTTRKVETTKIFSIVKKRKVHVMNIVKLLEVLRNKTTNTTKNVPRKKSNKFGAANTPLGCYI